MVGAVRDAVASLGCNVQGNFLPFFFFFLGPHLWHVEVPSLGVELGLPLLAYTIAKQRQIQATSATCLTAHGNARSLTV